MTSWQPALGCSSGQTAELRPGRRLANRYTIKKKIGEGGMGVIYEAMQELTQQEVALKVIHPDLVSPQLLKRFREEIRTLGKLQHDHIVHVFDADYDRSEPPNQDLLFYAMQLVEGLPLDQWVAETHPTVEARLECFVQICEAVDYAHRHGVVHRDLKPENILVNAAGRPAILDFGLAHIIDLAFDLPDAGLSCKGQSLPQVSGTPAFMSPERWEGYPGGVPADVFALGVLLHELLTGTRPWKVQPGATLEDLRRAIHGFSADQFKEHSEITRPLSRLLRAMLAQDPASRPTAVAEVAKATRTLLARRRLRRRIQHAAPLWGGITLGLGLVIAIQSHSWWLKKREQDSESRLMRASLIARKHSQGDTLAEVIKLLPPKPQLSPSPGRWRDVLLEAMATWNLSSVKTVPLPTGFDAIADTQDGIHFFGRSGNGSWTVIEKTGGTWLPIRLRESYEFVRARINVQQSQVAALSTAGELVIWQWNQNQLTNLVLAAPADTQFEFSPDGRYFACSATVSGRPGSEPLAGINVWDTQTWKPLALLCKSGEEPEPGTFIYVRSRPVAGLAFSPDGTHLAAWSHGSSHLLVWNWSEERLESFASHNSALAAAAWRPGPAAGELAVVQINGQIRVWKLPLKSQSATYVAAGDAMTWGRATANADGRFAGLLSWTRGGDAVAAIDEADQVMEVFAPGASADPFRVSLRAPGEGWSRWLSSGAIVAQGAHSKWVPFDSEVPVRRILRISAFNPRYLAFNPAGTLLAAADATRIAFVATTSGVILGRVEMPLSGPITFDPTTGDLWAYNKTNGPIRWTTAGGEIALTTVPAAQAVGQSHVGQLAASGGNLVFSRGTNIFVCAKGTLNEPARALPDFGVDSPPQQLSIAANGRRVAAIWLNPLRACLFRREPRGSWVLELAVSNAPVLSNLPRWNPEALLTLRPDQGGTSQEQWVKSHKTHFGSPVLVTTAANIPMVAWLQEAEQGVHLDYLGTGGCIHIANLPFEREQGLQTPMALSPDGLHLAIANSKGDIHLWDLRRALQNLAELQLGIEAIDFATAGRFEQSPKSLIITTPGSLEFL